MTPDAERRGLSAGVGSGLSHPARASPDVDECLEQSDECHYHQICANTPGGHRCGCPRGYRTQGPGLPCLGMGTPRPAHRQGVFVTRAMVCA